MKTQSKLQAEKARIQEEIRLCQGGLAMEELQHQLRDVERRIRASEARKARAVMRSLGLVHVRGALGGVYWE